jgi:hypothetical protein
MSQTAAALFEFGRPIAGPDSVEVRKQQTFLGQGGQNVGDFLPKVNLRHGAGLLAGVADDVVIPVNVLAA